jgi:hypothetical protein
MTDPIVFISRNRVKEGMFDDFRKHYFDSIPLIGADKPGTLPSARQSKHDASQVCAGSSIVPITERLIFLQDKLQSAAKIAKPDFLIAACDFFRKVE